MLRRFLNLFRPQPAPPEPARPASAPRTSSPQTTRPPANTNSPSAQPLALPRIPSHQTPYGVDLIDLRPFTQTMVSMTKDESCARNATSYRKRSGREFINAPRSSPITTACDLRYPCDHALADGRLFLPTAMEDKWAVYLFANTLYFVRSWTATVTFTATTRRHLDELIVTSITESRPTAQAHTNPPDNPRDRIRLVDCLIRCLCLREPCPFPIPNQPATDEHVAMYAFSVLGRAAFYASTEDLVGRPAIGGPSLRIRSTSDLFMAADRGDIETVRTLLDTGADVQTRDPYDGMSPLHAAASSGELVVIDELLRRGADIEAASDTHLTPLHYAISARSENPAIAHLLLRGASANPRSEDGSSALQFAVQGGSAALVELLLHHGADPHIASTRGFVPIHSAAEMGRADLCELLLTAGADPHAVAEGHTPASLARGRGHEHLATHLENYTST